jgi:hypothetical protein
VLGTVAVVNTDQVRAIVTCTNLTVGHTYRLSLTAITDVSTGRVETRNILLKCVQ